MEKLIQRLRYEYCIFRESELSAQIIHFHNLIGKIEEIFANNYQNPDFFNEDKIRGFSFKALSLFSQSKRAIISDNLKLKGLFTQLETAISKSRDFDTLDFSGQIETKQKTLGVFTSIIIEVKSSFAERTDREFENFNLGSSREKENVEDSFKNIEIALTKDNSSVEYSSLLNRIKDEVSKFVVDLHRQFRVLVDYIHCSKDIDNDYNPEGTLNQKLSSLSRIELDIDLIQKNFNSKIQNEFEKINWLQISLTDLILPNLADLQEKSKELILRFNSDSWTLEIIHDSNFNSLFIDLERIIAREKEYFSGENDFFTIEFKWYQFFNVLTEKNKKVINELKSKVNWRKVFLIHYLNLLLMNSANIDLPTNSDEHSELEKSLSAIGKEQLRYIREFWFSKQIDTTREFEHRNDNISVENIYNKRSSNRFKRLSLRQIVQFDTNLFTTFFPIILTSPDVCCNLFKHMNGYFDIVMFDEASQLRLEDNLPSILKGKQIIIAGDEHQMPPSNYFSKVFDGYVEDEDDIEEEEIIVDKDNNLLSCESLLDFGTELNFEKKLLEFHYRSRHPYLIDFSNYAFYNQRLMPLPNIFEYVPIKYIQVNGTFSDHTNEAEAEMVLSIIENNINRLPNGEYPTIGVATFNIAQRNLIISKISQRKKFEKYTHFNEKIQELGLDDPKSNKSFIKNLENIQGDEKDVVILSTTYGVGKDGKFAHRFGPLNHSKGYKLLNVIITRAKYKVYVCSSIPPQIFLNYKEYLTIEGSNNKRAIFYAYLAYSKAVSESNSDLRLSVLTALSENAPKNTSINVLNRDLESPFEEEVYERLVDVFGEEKLIPQFKFAGFRIDIVYDPKIEGVPKIAIECDGAKYHEKREAYLYDSFRQKILESHGFVFHRIWSTNWWKNPGRETARLVHFIKDTVTTTQKKCPTHSSTISTAFTDDFVNIDTYISQLSFIDTEKEVESIQRLEEQKPQQLKIFSNEIKLKSRVKVKYVNNGKDIIVQLVETTNNKLGTSEGVQKINIKSPLATSILGHSIGDIVKVGNLDNYVEILEVTN